MQLDRGKVEQQLTQWRSDLEEWYSKYDWLLFLNLPKVLKLYKLLQTKGVSQIATEVGFLFPNTSATRKALRIAVKVHYIMTEGPILERGGLRDFNISKSKISIMLHGLSEFP